MREFLEVTGAACAAALICGLLIAAPGSPLLLIAYWTIQALR